MVNRLSRDQIIHRALDRIDSRSLDQKERPQGILQENAMCIAWLQEGIDYIHRNYPVGGDLTSTTATIAAGSQTTTSLILSNYNLDLRDGVVINTPTNYSRRLRRISYQKLINRLLGNSGQTGTPQCYCIQGTILNFDCTTDRAYSMTLHYYKLPDALTATSIPTFPDDWTLVSYLTMCGKEWTGEMESGSAIGYASKIVARLKTSGMQDEAESNEIPLDPWTFRPSGNDQFGGDQWMGDTVPR